MRVSKELPPNYEKIRQHFPVTPETVFTYGETVYVPSGAELSPDLKVHEATHIKQQSAMGPEAWWDRYITDATFRLSQEGEAYRAQYRSGANRAERRRILPQIIKDLASPLYGGLVTKEQAREAITR